MSTLKEGRMNANLQKYQHANVCPFLTSKLVNRMVLNHFVIKINSANYFFTCSNNSGQI